MIDAAAGGAGVGLRLAANVSAMLLAFIALVAMINYGLGWLHTSLQQIFGFIFAPFAWVMGVPWGEARAFGNLLGTQMTLNEFVAYLDLTRAAGAGTLSPRSVVIATYALCGFANFSSIAIQIGGIGSLAPGRRADVARLGLKAMFAGTARLVDDGRDRGVPDEVGPGGEVGRHGPSRTALQDPPAAVARTAGAGAPPAGGARGVARHPDARPAVPARFSRGTAAVPAGAARRLLL